RHLQPPAVQGKRLEPRRGMVAKTRKDIDRIGWRRENRQTADIHRRFGGLSVEEGSIQRREPVHLLPLSGGRTNACAACSHSEGLYMRREDGAVDLTLGSPHRRTGLDVLRT